MPFITHNGERVVKYFSDVKTRRYINIMTETTYNNFEGVINKATIIHYDDLRDYIIKNWDKIITDPNKRHQINVLTYSGWRTSNGYAFKGKPTLSNFYDENEHYKNASDGNKIYAIQIIEF